MSKFSEHGLRKIVSVNTTDLGGGAEHIALQLTDAYAARGLESWLLVGDKKTDNRRVMPFYLSPTFNYRPYANRWTQGRLRALKWLCQKTGVDDFEFPYARHLLELTGSVPDLVHCHNLHGGYFDLRALPWISKRVPVFVTLQDAWLTTGHCAFPVDCPRWQTSCGHCPDLNRPPAVKKDATDFNWQRKARILERCQLHLISPSHWMEDMARRSLLAPAIASSTVIPHGVDLEVFRPGNKAAARQLLVKNGLAIPPDAFLMVTVANAGSDNILKDWSTICGAMERLSPGDSAAPLHLMVIGGKQSTECLGPVTVHHVGFLPHAELARYYQAADLFIHATHADTFGLVIAEAMACAVPVLVTAVGATPEVVGDESTGMLIPARDPEALAARLRHILARPDSLADMGAAGARRARERFYASRMVDQHLALYAKVTSDWRARNPDYVYDALETVL
jgi:glycosyltransferase involved in cell wall biosynthesis